MPQILGGRYKVGQKFAQGGIANVHYGEDLSTSERVAIKVLKPAVLAQEQSLTKRFEREVQALDSLNHPNIVRMLATGVENSDRYLVMEYLSGGTLAQYAKDPLLSLTELLQTACALADALDITHKKAILHRDIKPSNILLDEEGFPKLADYGLALIANSTITPDGIIVGTCAYLPPEAIDPRSLTPASDIWAFGVMLFELLTGKLPFDGRNYQEMWLAITTQPTPNIQQLRPEIPNSLATLIYQMLEKDPKDRISSARKVKAELETILSG